MWAVAVNLWYKVSSDSRRHADLFAHEPRRGSFACLLLLLAIYL